MPGVSGDFNKPIYSGELFQEPKPSPLEMIKPHAGKIVAVIAVIAVAYLAYWFFVGSYHNVNVSITGKDGIEVSAVSGEIMQDGKIIGNIDSKSSRFRLKEGDYGLEVRADGMQTEGQSFTVGGKDSAVPIVMEKATDSLISGIQFSKGSGDEIFTGSNPATILVSNSGSEESVEIIMEAENGITLQTTVLANTIPAGTTNFPISADIKVNEQISIKASTGDSKTLKFRIKGSSKKFEKTVTLKKRANVQLSSITDISAKAGSRITKDITITNREKYELVGEVEFSIVPSPKFNQTAEVNTWFKVLPAEGLQKLTIGPNKITIELDIPASAQSDDFSVEFSASAKNQSWASSTQVFDVEIEGAKTLLAAKLKSATASPKLGQAGLGNQITLTNTTDFTLTNIEITVEPACYETFIKNMTPVKIDELSNQQGTNIQTVTFTSEVPALGDVTFNEEKPCNITISYDDPLNPTEMIYLPDLLMKITPKQ